jgi:hypothetical protein
VHSTTAKKWTLCAVMASVVMAAATTAVPVMTLGGCGANISYLCVKKTDAGAGDGGQGGGGGEAEGSSSTVCP